MMLSDSIKSANPPSIVIYGMIPHHVKRNYLNKNYLLATAKSWRKIPHFELVNGELVFQGTIGPTSGMENGPELRRKEHEITSAYRMAMQKMCAERDIPFIVVFLPPNSNYPLPVISTLSRFNIPWLDLTEIKYEGLNAGKDTHPSPRDHRRIAIGIDKSFVSDILVNLENSVK